MMQTTSVVLGTNEYNKTSAMKTQQGLCERTSDQHLKDPGPPPSPTPLQVELLFSKLHFFGVDIVQKVENLNTLEFNFFGPLKNGFYIFF